MNLKRHERFRGLLETHGLPMPPGTGLVDLRYNMGRQDWYWYDNRRSDGGWKFLPMGPSL